MTSTNSKAHTMHEINRKNLVSFFEAGCKEKQSLGFELEHILLHKDTNKPVSYTEPGGVHDILERLKPHYRDASYDDGHIIGLTRRRETITIEPAGQLEISAGPYETVTAIEHAYTDFRALLDPILDDFGVYTPFYGYNPSAKAQDLTLVPKRRYECMTEFLGAQSYSGLCMMRGTASLQISVDYANEQEAIMKLRLGQKFTPLLALMSDNSPIFETKPVEGHMARTGVWAGMWQDRVGTIPGSLSQTYSFEDYADYILSREAILVPCATSTGGWEYVANQTFDSIYHDQEMNPQELEHALSMVWPDARLKDFVEIRPADALPPQYAFAYTALIHALFYNNDALTHLDTMLAEYGEDDIAQAKQNLMAHGYDGRVYGNTAAWWTRYLIDLAQDGASAEDIHYMEPLAKLVQEQRTPKEEA